MGFLSKVKDFFIGGTVDKIGDAAEGVADIVERWNPGVAKKHEMTMEIAKFMEQSYASARAHDQPMNSGIKIIDALVNGVNRLIRPWVTITVVGHMFGYWRLPPPDSIDAQYWDITLIVLGFWFGGRALFKDLPTMVKSLRG